VQSASDGEAGVKLILEFVPDVAVVDMGLPLLDGCEVAMRVREKLGPDGIRLIAMTGYGQATDRERARNAGFDDHLVKPVAPKHLVEVIAKTLGR
jgi:CheY-like chemotaxis protein